jgi:hypothetical protein
MTAGEKCAARKACTMDEYLAAIDTDQPEAERIVRAFAVIIRFYEVHGKHEIELARALGDRDRLVKEQIKLSTFQHAHSILLDAYHRVTGRRITDE